MIHRSNRSAIAIVCIGFAELPLLLPSECPDNWQYNSINQNIFIPALVCPALPWNLPGSADKSELQHLSLCSGPFSLLCNAVICFLQIGVTWSFYGSNATRPVGVPGDDFPSGARHLWDKREYGRTALVEDLDTLLYDLDRSPMGHSIRVDETTRSNTHRSSTGSSSKSHFISRKGPSLESN